MKKHLAIMDKLTIDAILSGTKIIETRFSLHKIAPFGVISSGDLVYLKPPGEEIIGQFRVKKVFFFDGLSQNDFLDLKRRYEKEINADETYWNHKKDCKFGTLIFIAESERFITSPIKIKKSDQRGWMVIV
ncbi:MAG: hypothetical protein Q7R43_05290 [Candidatus Daviesbacteria bacterium]|nr:hypothetical protein [Candidatus Daviesbacteria bacterium]